ncbi:sorting and assembly machinery component 50 homolog B [Arctopsyche grandis]|uniref:sorting and assembly machinery component 50 homolog B n=1 Tax=Arctopsyche grandis TaxID=121162 RepID=UPI00406D66B8
MGTVHAKEKSSFANMEMDPNMASPKIRPRHIPQKISLNQSKARVDKVNIEGLARTKNDVIEASVNELFKATNFEDVLVRADKVRSKLHALGCFSNIGVLVDVSSGPQASADGLEVTFHVDELRRVTGGVNTTVGNNTGSLVIGMKVPNFAGRGESLQCEYSRGLQKSSNFSVTVAKPYPYKKFEPMLSASILQQVGDFVKSGYRQLDKGLLFDLGFRTNPKAYHNLQYEILFRDTSALSRATSFAVRESAGPTMKSAVRHIITLDGRDDRILPTIGNLLQFTTELSGLGGSMSFLKNELYFQTNYNIMDECILQGTFQTGLLNNFHGANLTEHFYLGGPLSIRGFDLRGIGPQSDGSALGCNFFWATGIHLYTPLPFKPGKGGIGDSFKTHFFLNAGNIGPLENVLDLDVNRLIKDVRLTSGIGIALRIGNIAKLELNYSFPLKFLPSDITAPGLGFGLGVNFL